MKKTNRKAFTIVELVIVIAIIAILAAVLIPTFSSIITMSRKSADLQLAKNMNLALATDEAQNGPCKTMDEAITVIFDAGYSVDKLTPTATGCHIVWDEDTNRIVYFDSNYSLIYSEDDTLNKNHCHLWKVAHSIEDFEVAGNANNFGFSYYLADDYEGAIPQTISTGLDVGNKAIAAINYDRHEITDSNNAQDVIIRTKGGTLTVNAPVDTVKHYGEASVIDIYAIANASYHEYGVVTMIKVASGRVVVENTEKSEVVGIFVKAPADASATNDGVKIEVNNTQKTAPAIVVATGVDENKVQEVKVGGEEKKDNVVSAENRKSESEAIIEIGKVVAEKQATENAQKEWPVITNTATTQGVKDAIAAFEAGTLSFNDFMDYLLVENFQKGTTITNNLGIAAAGQYKIQYCVNNSYKNGLALKGKIVLDRDVEISTNVGWSTTLRLVVPEGQTLTIDLNGHTLTARAGTGISNATFLVRDGGILNIIDSSNEKTGKISVVTGFVQVNDGGTVNVFSGTICCDAKLSKYNSVIAGVAYNDYWAYVVHFYTPNKLGTFNFYGGTLSSPATRTDGTKNCTVDNGIFYSYEGCEQYTVINNYGGTLGEGANQ